MRKRNEVWPRNRKKTGEKAAPAPIDVEWIIDAYDVRITIRIGMHCA